MLNYQVIESKDNAQLKYVVRLAKESKLRKSEQQAVIYGEHLLCEAIAKKLVSQIFVNIDKLTKYQALIDKLNIKVMLLNSELMQKINILDSEIDIAAIINLPIATDFNPNQDCIVLENIQDPGNLGTILRVANASGITQVVLSDGSVDVYNPKVLRASQGIQLALNIYSNQELNSLLASFNGQVLALTPHSKLSVYDYDLTQNTAFVFGNEGNGLSEQLLAQIDQQVKIPMMGNTESINLAMATTAVAFEMSRQRLKV